MTMPSRSPLATAFVLIRPTTTGFGPALKRELTGASAGAGAAGATAGESWTKGFQKSGITKAAKKITEGLIGAGIASVVMAVKFQSAMERVHTQAGVTQGKIRGLSDGILNLAGKVGFSPDSLATSLYHVESSFASLGITGKKALQIVKIAAEGAAVGGANLEDVTNALTAVMASGIKITHGMSGAMGILNAIVGAGDMKMQDLADAFGTGLLASIKGFGVTITDAGAALATFGDNNIRGADAGTKLRQAIQALAAPTGAGKKLMEGWGLSVDRFAQDMRKGGLRLALEDLQKQFKRVGVTSKEQGQVLTELFGKRAGVGIQILLGQMGRFESKFRDLNRGAGSFADAWKRTQATASQQFRELTQGLVAIGVKIGEKLLPPLMSVFGFVRTHTGLVLTLAGVIGGLAIGITAVSLAIKVWTAATEVLTAAQWLLDVATSANPIGATIILIGALVIAIVLLWKHASWFRTAVRAVWDAIKIAFDAVWGALKTGFAWVVTHWKLLAAILFGPVGLAVDAIVTHWKFVTKVLAGFWHWLKTAWQDTYKDIVHPFATAVAFIWGLWQRALRDVQTVIARIRAFFAPAVHWLFGAGKALIGGLFGGVWDVMKSVGSWVARVGGAILKAVTSFFGIKSPSTKFFAIGVNLMKGLFQGMVHGAPGLAKWVVGQIKNLGGTIVNDLLGFLGFGGGSPGGGPPPGHASGSYQKYAQSLFGGFGWGADQIGSLIALWNQESGWNPIAQNPKSTAYGIAQFLDTTWAPYGPKTSDPYKQIFYGEEYIRSRYGSPGNAWAHELAYNWYDKGGFLPPGLSLAYNGTGRPEQVVGPRGGGGPAKVVLVISGGGGGEFERFMTKFIRKYVRTAGGGDVQVAFGGN